MTTTLIAAKIKSLIFLQFQLSNLIFHYFYMVERCQSIATDADAIYLIEWDEYTNANNYTNTCKL